MIKKNMLKEYLRYILPTMLTFTLASVYSIVDGMFVGHAVGDAGVAGINVAFPLVAFVMAVGTGIGMGGGVISSIARGAGDEAKSRRAVGTTFTLLLLAALPVMALLLFAAEPICRLLGGQGGTLEQAVAYTSVIAWGVPFQIFVTGCTPLIRNQGRVGFAMAVQVLAGLMNVLLDYVFVMLFGWGTAGIGIATVIAAALSAVIVVAFLMREEGPFRLHLRELRICGPELAGILRIGIPAGIQGAVFSLSNTVVQATINGFGSAAIAGSAATLNFEYYTYFFVNAFGQTAVTFTGQNFAAKNADRCRAIFRWCVLFGFTSSLILGVTFTALGTRALGLFTTDAAALSFGLVRLWFVELPDCLTTFYEVPAGAMRGMGWSTLPAVITILGSCVLRVALVTWVFPLSGTWDTLMVIYPVTWSFMIVAMLVSYFIVRRRCYRSIEPAAA